MNFSIRTKLLLIIGVVFVVLATGIIGVSTYMVRNITREAERVIDAGTNDVYTEKVRSIFNDLQKSYATLQATLKETGLAGTQMAAAYETEAQNEAVKVLHSHYYGKTGGDAARIYPFILDGKGLIVLHPDLPRGDNSISNRHTAFVQKMLQTERGVLQYSDKGENKWVFYRQFGPWKWTIGFDIPESVKYAGVRNITKMLLSLRNNLTIIDALLAVMAMITLGFYITGKIISPINVVINGLNDGSTQVAEAASQMASTNLSIAQGAAEQAATIEETSASCEQLSSMTRQNADNANQADALMETTNNVVGQANNSMAELIDAMENISSASKQTAKIIKTIDEVAFQTNLLALNAAVEAARAGAAGAGFAVVADEVGNLAKRTSEAARNTETLIQSTIIKVKDGSNLVSKTSEAFGQVAANASKVKELLAEISAASGEQAQGVEQINRAVVEVDKVVQQTAAFTEEGAGASEQLSGQASVMKDKVRDLITLVGG